MKKYIISKEVEVDFEIDKYVVSEFIDHQTEVGVLEEIIDIAEDKLASLSRYTAKPFRLVAPNLSAQIELEEIVESFKKKWHIVDD